MDRKVRRFCGCYRTDCCLRTNGWDGYDWVPDEWADDEQIVENQKAEAAGSGMRWPVYGRDLTRYKQE